MKSTENGYVSRKAKEGSGHISIEKRDFKGEVPLHWHNFYELELILDGHGIQTLNGEEYTVERGTAYLLTPTDFHTVKAITPMKLWHISFDEHILTESRIFELSSGTFQKSFSLNEKIIEKLSSLFYLLEDEAKLENGCSRELCECLLSLLSRQGSCHQGRERAKLSGMRRAILYMNMHFRENPSLKVISAQAGFHPNYFSEIFKASTGKNYKEHLTELKIGYAKSLLTAGLSVSDSCYYSGFGSVSNFLSAFKRIVGMTPLEYKKTATV